jgi:hypothetical protein
MPNFDDLVRELDDYRPTRREDPTILARANKRPDLGTITADIAVMAKAVTTTANKIARMKPTREERLARARSDFERINRQATAAAAGGYLTGVQAALLESRLAAISHRLGL